MRTSTTKCSICGQAMNSEAHFHNKFSEEYYHSANSINGKSCYELWVMGLDKKPTGRNDVLTGNL